MEPIGFATLYTRPRQLKDLDNISDLWLADALTREGDVRLYIKKASKEEILAECLCALLARQLELPVPRAFIVRDPGDLIGGGYFSGSEDTGSPSIKQRLKQGDPLAEHMLRNWDRLHELTLFDEWIANRDRNLGNLLWGGGDDWSLIDHAFSLWSYLDKPRADLEVRNIFAELIRIFEGDLGPARLQRACGEFADRCRKIDHDELQTASQSDLIGMLDRSKVTLSSLKERLSLMPKLLSRHGNQLDLLP